MTTYYLPDSPSPELRAFIEARGGVIAEATRLKYCGTIHPTQDGEACICWRIMADYRQGRLRHEVKVWHTHTQEIVAKDSAVEAFTEALDRLAQTMKTEANIMHALAAEVTR